MLERQTNDRVFRIIQGKDYQSVLELVGSGQVHPDEVISSPDGIEFTLLNAVVEGNNVQAVRELIQMGANVNQSSSGQSSLYVAASLGHLEVVRLLLESGADPSFASDSEESSNETPLMVAAKYPEIVRLLLTSGADPKFFDGDGHSAMLPASIIGDREVMRMLFKAGCPVTGECLHMPVYRRELDIVQQMLEQQPDLDKGFPWTGYITKGEYPLIVAVEKNTEDCQANESNRLGIIKALLSAGANVEVKDQLFGRTPLVIAVEGKDAEVARMLILAGADPSEQIAMKTGRKTSPLDLARSRGLQDLVDVMQLKPDKS